MLEGWAGPAEGFCSVSWTFAKISKYIKTDNEMKWNEIDPTVSLHTFIVGHRFVATA